MFVVCVVLRDGQCLLYVYCRNGYSMCVADKFVVGLVVSVTVMDGQCALHDWMASVYRVCFSD